MRLLDSCFEPCFCLIAAVSDTPSVSYTKGAPFSAAILFGSRGLLAKAQEEPDHPRCSVTVSGNAPLAYGDLFLRCGDNTVFRVLSDPDETLTPPMASLKLQQVRAERIGFCSEFDIL